MPAPFFLQNAKNQAPEENVLRSLTVFYKNGLSRTVLFLSQNQEQHNSSSGADRADPQHGGMHRIAGNRSFGSDLAAASALAILEFVAERIDLLSGLQNLFANLADTIAGVALVRAGSILGVLALRLMAGCGNGFRLCVRIL